MFKSGLKLIYQMLKVTVTVFYLMFRSELSLFTRCLNYSYGSCDVRIGLCLGQKVAVGDIMEALGFMLPPVSFSVFLLSGCCCN